MTDYKSVNEKVGGRASIVAVSKFHPYEAVVEAYNEGAMIFGENRVQEMRDKFPPKNERPEGMKVYLIGQLQRNKVRKALEWCDRIESVDSIPLIDKIEKDADRDYWMSAEEAVGYGMADSVLIKSESKQV